jgi:hypothetical protein
MKRPGFFFLPRATCARTQVTFRLLLALHIIMASYRHSLRSDAIAIDFGSGTSIDSNESMNESCDQQIDDDDDVDERPFSSSKLLEKNSITNDIVSLAVGYSFNLPIDTTIRINYQLEVCIEVCISKHLPRP